jgi:ankyrin repeat protein
MQAATLLAGTPPVQPSGIPASPAAVAASAVSTTPMNATATIAHTDINSILNRVKSPDGALHQLHTPRAVFSRKIEHPSASSTVEAIRPPILDVTKALAKSVAAGNSAAVSSLLEAGASANAADARGVSMIHSAARAGVTAIVLQLRDAGANIHAVDTNGNGALHHAADRVLPVVTALVEAGCDVHAVNTKGSTPLMLAAGAGNLAVASYLVGAGAAVNAVDHGGKSALVYAAKAGVNGAMTVIMLVEAGADVNAVNGAALCVAVSLQHEEVVRVLLRAGADVNVVGTGGNTPLILAASGKSATILSALVEAGAKVNAENDKGDTALTSCLSWDNTAVMFSCILLKAGAIDRTKHTEAIMLTAAHAGRTEHVISMAEAGVDVNAGESMTALISACQLGNVTLAAYLLKAGARLNTLDYQGRTALHSAAAAKNGTRLTSMLLGAGADVNIGDKKGVTPLIYAASYEHQHSVPAMALLLQASALINAVDNLGDTALHKAVAAGHTTNAEFLVQQGANINAVNAAGQSPLHLVPQFRSRINTLLLKAGADVHVVNAWGQTVLAANVGRGTEFLLQLASGASFTAGIEHYPVLRMG